MPDTGAPWNIPYVAPSDLVRDYPSDSEDLADAIADGLDAAGGLVAVKHALFTGTMAETSVATGANFAITDLSITHTLADAANKLIISAYVGVAADSVGTAAVALAVADDGTPVAIGDADGSRTRVAAGGFTEFNANSLIVRSPAITFVYSPGDTASHTYTVKAFNMRATATIYINRNEGDTDEAGTPRGSSSLVIQEVKV
jgi:hypothetical protein